MLGEFAPGWRPKTRPKNKLRLNMKKLLDPCLNVEGVTILDELSSDEKAESKKLSPKKKKTTAAKASSCQPVKKKHQYSQQRNQISARLSISCLPCFLN